MGGLTESEAWKELQAHHGKMKDQHLRELFAENDDRVDLFSADAGLWHIDYSKHLVDKDTISHLMTLARDRGVESVRDQMFSGENINTTEDRAVLHVALRNPADSHLTHDGKDVIPEVRHTLARMGALAEAIHSGSWTGFTGKKINAIVNIGIGGSDLGPRMVTRALKAHAVDGLDVRFISNVDYDDFHDTVVDDLDPETTLFVIVSKTFTTDETITNALTARLWISEVMGEKSIDRHFVAVSTNNEKAKSFGITETNIFEFWDWVGGRYSLSSAVGLSIMLATGSARFEQLLKGMHEMDEHFRTKPLEENVPVIMAMLSIWYSNFFDSQTELLAPYSQSMEYWADFVQQLSMESNGKTVDISGNPLSYKTAPIIWGTTGTNAQHSYYQFLHQGTHLVPVDFIGFKKSNHSVGDHQRKLLANMIAQGEALAFGRSVEDLAADNVPKQLQMHKAMPGNGPSSTLTSEQLTPQALGQLIALYEHKTFVQGIIWGINSFDQWGVELGKKLAGQIASEMHDPKKSTNHDSSTNSLIDRLK